MYNKANGWSLSRPQSNRSYDYAPYTPAGRQYAVKKKRSGAKAGMYQNRSMKTDGSGEAKPYVSGWRASRGVLTTFLCAPYKDTSRHKSKAGRVWENWIAKVREGNGQPFPQPCLYDTMTGKIIIKSLGVVINPKAPNGGYCGSFVRRSTSNYRR